MICSNEFTKEHWFQWDVRYFTSGGLELKVDLSHTLIQELENGNPLNDDEYEIIYKTLEDVRDFIEEMKEHPLTIRKRTKGDKIDDCF
tara:strand:+ start:265 stop:528 length:264 start_codon:yes stop_codon:yes gene_type:complete